MYKPLFKFAANKWNFNCAGVTEKHFAARSFLLQNVGATDINSHRRFNGVIACGAILFLVERFEILFPGDNQMKGYCRRHERRKIFSGYPMGEDDSGAGIAGGEGREFGIGMTLMFADEIFPIVFAGEALVELRDGLVESEGVVHTSGHKVQRICGHMEGGIAGPATVIGDVIQRAGA